MLLLFLTAMDAMINRNERDVLIIASIASFIASIAVKENISPAYKRISHIPADFSNSTKAAL